MKELLYYTIFAIILYFLLSAVFDKFYLEQENFDTSLVPVSSIVTLAKITQKLVNGGGTLTNPGNLQIGESTAKPGNLTVMGNANITGKITANTLNFNSRNNSNQWRFYSKNDTQLGYGLVNSNGTVADKAVFESSSMGSVVRNTLPASDGINYFNSNVIIDNGKLCGNAACDANGNITVPGNLTISGTFDQLLDMRYLYFKYLGIENILYSQSILPPNLKPYIDLSSWTNLVTKLGTYNHQKCPSFPRALDSYVGDCLCEDGSLLGQPFDGPHPADPWQTIKRRVCPCPADINTKIDSYNWRPFAITCKCPNNSILNIRESGMGWQIPRC